MGRTKGSPNKKKPGDKDYIAPGRKAGQISVASRLPQMTDTEILDYKVKILEILSQGQAEVDGKVIPIKTFSDACRYLGLKPQNVYRWTTSDKDFQELLKTVYEVIADDLEHEFLTNKEHYYLPKMMLLKGIRPMYRDQFKVEHNSDKLEQMLLELKKLGEPKEIEDNP